MSDPVDGLPALLARARAEGYTLRYDEIDDMARWLREHGVRVRDEPISGAATPWPCICCGRALVSIFPEEAPHHPSDAVMCVATGNYGSTVFDPFHNVERPFNVCDDCFTAADAAGRIGPETPQAPAAYRAEREGR